MAGPTWEDDWSPGGHYDRLAGGGWPNKIKEGDAARAGRTHQAFGCCLPLALLAWLLRRTA